MSDNTAANIWGWVTGAIGFGGLVQLLYIIVQSQLPSSKVKVLDELLDETMGLFHSVVERGLLPDQGYIVTITGQLAAIEDNAEKAKISVNCSTSIWRQMEGMFCGLSYEIHSLCGKVKEIRANISKTTFKERERLEREGRLPLLSYPGIPRGDSDAPHTLEFTLEDATETDLADLGYMHLQTLKLPYVHHLPGYHIGQSSDPSHLTVESD